MKGMTFGPASFSILSHSCRALVNLFSAARKPFSADLRSESGSFVHFSPLESFVSSTTDPPTMFHLPPGSTSLIVTKVL